MGTVLIPYRGDLVSARLNYKREKKRVARKFKRKLLDIWDLNRTPLWWNGGGYVNDKLRKLLGIEKDFLKGQDTSGITAFGIELKPTADIDKILSLSVEQKEYLKDKAISIFTKYGKKVSIAFETKSSYDYKIFKITVGENNQNIETETLDFDLSDEELAVMLYSRMIMYMVDNDSTDTIDTWKDVNPSSVDFWNGSVQSTLKYYTYTLKNEDIEKMVNDRLFTKRNYRVLGKSEDVRTYANTIDLDLFNELLDENLETVIERPNLWNKSNGTYTLNIAAVRELDAEEFLIFIQTHLTTYYDKKKKKWYQKGFFGFIVVVVAIVVAVLTANPASAMYIIGASLGTALVIAGIVLSVAGALLGNQVMMMGGQFVSLVGGGINVADAIIAEQAAIESARATLIAQGESGIALLQKLNEVASQKLLETTLQEGGKFAFKVYSTMNSMASKDILEDTSSSITPSEKMNELYIAEDSEWDFVNQFMPEFIIASTMKIM